MPHLRTVKHSLLHVISNCALAQNPPFTLQQLRGLTGFTTQSRCTATIADIFDSFPTDELLNTRGAKETTNSVCIRQSRAYDHSHGDGGGPEDPMLEQRVGRLEEKVDRIEAILTRLEPQIIGSSATGAKQAELNKLQSDFIQLRGKRGDQGRSSQGATRSSRSQRTRFQPSNVVDADCRDPIDMGHGLRHSQLFN